MSFESDWRALTAIPPPTFTTEGVELLARDHWKTIEAIRSGLKPIEAEKWQANYRDLYDFFRLDDERQCFSEARYEWTTFYEPQITRGLAHFLDAAPTHLRVARCAAFARAASASCKPEHRRSFSGGRNHARVVAEEKRIDLLVEFTDERGRFGVAVEAKFNHQLTEGQLESAVEHADLRAWNLDRSLFLVVGPYLDKLDGPILENNHRWSRATWWALLRHMENELPVEADCAEFRRLRSTIWSQCYV